MFRKLDMQINGCLGKSVEIVCDLTSAVNATSSPVMLAKEASIYLAIFVSQSFSRPEGKTFQLSPYQWMGLRLHPTKQAIISHYTFSIKLPIISSSRMSNIVCIGPKKTPTTTTTHAWFTEPVVSLLASWEVALWTNFNFIHLVMETRQGISVVYFQVWWAFLKSYTTNYILVYHFLSIKLTSCSQILTITFAVAVSLWFPAQKPQTVKCKSHSVLIQSKILNDNQPPL